MSTFVLFKQSETIYNLLKLLHTILQVLAFITNQELLIRMIPGLLGSYTIHTKYVLLFLEHTASHSAPNINT
jgi:hypothetical protein